jgi:hypothetical protein
MTDPDPDNDDSEFPDRPSDDSRLDRPTAEAKRYLGRVAEQPNEVREEQARIIELLSTGGSSTANREMLERRAAASCTLAKLARDDPPSLEDSLPTLIEELRSETGRELSADRSENRAASRTIRDRLVRTVAYIIVSEPRTAIETDGFADFVDAVTIDLDERTLRVASKALFASADERSAELASATELLSELLVSPDEAVQAWAAGTVGKVAEKHPDAVASTTADLHRLLKHDNTTVQHNAVEALAAFVRERPDTVAPAVDALRDLLAHEETAIQYNAAGVLGWLAEDHPDAVIPVVGELEDLRDHDVEAVRRIATGALARLANERSDGVID